MKRTMSATVFFFIMAGFHSLAMAQEGVKSLAEEVSVSLELRPRYEYVDVDGSDRDTAHALTVRTAVGLKVKDLLKVGGLSAYLEATNVSNFGLLDHYDSTSKIGGNDNTEYEAVADPPITRMTQAYLSYSSRPMTLSFGRKVLALDNQRFIGSVNWRQMPQTFGVADFAFDYGTKGLIYAAYVYERMGIKDELNEHTKGVNSFLVNASYAFSPLLKATAYAYLINSTHNTYGLRMSGKHELNALILDYLLEGALQEDPTINDRTDPDADSYYYNLEAGLTYDSFILRGNYERFGEADGDAATGFSVPWGTNHAFNGWSDVLIGKVTGGDPFGLQDANATVGYSSKNIGKLLAVFHKFDSARESKDYGKELDLLYSKNIRENLELLIKAAFYEEGDDFGKDTVKLWLMATYKFKGMIM